jgi:peptidylprolyl isomerase
MLLFALRRVAPLLVVHLACACEQAKPPPEQVPKATSIESDEDDHDSLEPGCSPLPPPAAARPSTTPPMPPPPPRPHIPIPAPSDVAAAPKDAIRTKSGLTMKVLVAGTGKERPKVEDRVKANYTGWAKNGVMFDSTVARAVPKIFRVDQVIKGFTEALPLMVTGEKRRLWVPSSLAYGDKPPVGVPAGSLVFDIELLEIFSEPETPHVPEDVKAPPEGVAKTESGLAYRLLQKGTGTEHPNEKSRVMIHYSGFTPDGRMFDSSIPRGHPSSFSLRHVIKGLSEGLQLMTVGDRMRFWIPSGLAYTPKPRRGGAPDGPVVFDVELISFQ